MSTEENQTTSEGETDKEKQQRFKDETEEARKEMEEFEKQDELPSDLSEWPSGKAKYITFANEDDSAFGDGPTSKLGPGTLERHEDGSVSVDGEKVDNPDDYKADPVPGGPTDPDAAPLPGEEKKTDSDSEKD